MLKFPLSEVQVLHPLSMRPAREGDIPVRVKNSYNPQAPGTVITKERDMSKVCWIISCDRFHPRMRPLISDFLTQRLHFLVCSSGCANQHCFEIKYYHVGYSEHSNAWSVWLLSEGRKLCCFLDIILCVLVCL